MNSAGADGFLYAPPRTTSRAARAFSQGATFLRERCLMNQRLPAILIGYVSYPTFDRLR